MVGLELKLTSSWQVVAVLRKPGGISTQLTFPLYNTTLYTDNFSPTVPAFNFTVIIPSNTVNVTSQPSNVTSQPSNVTSQPSNALQEPPSNASLVIMLKGSTGAVIATINTYISGVQKTESSYFYVPNKSKKYIRSLQCDRNPGCNRVCNTPPPPSQVSTPTRWS